MASKSRRIKSPPASSRSPASKKPVRNVTPDKVDLRDRAYLPSVAIVPPLEFLAKTKLPVLSQGNSNACTGFSLAIVVNHLLQQSGRKTEAAVSPWMIYSMARRYDEYPGADDVGSSLRGALKGWYKHGVCAMRLWSQIDMPKATNIPGEDYWLDAVNRPMGAYYRVDTRSVTDMHVALNETGILYASATCHDGWLEDGKTKSRKGWAIPFRKAKPGDGGHAFAIVGYDARGFLVHNSWGEDWGDGGYATLTYEDWTEHAMDCWVVQVGVVTDEHRRVAASATPASGKKKAALSGDKVLARHQLAPYIIDMENNGCLSGSGEFRTGEDDVRALVTDYLDAARKDWGIKAGQPLDLCIYAHGGLVGEGDAADTCGKWWPALYAAKRFPIFLMWESDLWSTMKGRLADVVKGIPRTTGGVFDIDDKIKRWWDKRLESALAPPGSMLWGEMKQNAQAISGEATSGARLLFKHLAGSEVANEHPIRLHLVGHSAGSIVHSYLVDRFAAHEWEFESVSFMAPAVRVETFDERVRPWLESGRVKRFREFHLTDSAEQQDPTCKPILGYGRSLLYLVSQSFEGGREVPILGMDKYFPADLGRMRSVKVFKAPGGETSSTTHGGFDDDLATMATVIAGM
ncbi:MAG: C1 family peptidase [Betaproteobacteria bacterium]|nr:C1 family peptidase [Betaproteobacteria bacterium]